MQITPSIGIAMYPGDGSDQAAVVSTIITMTHNLRLSVIAEGVETEEQLDYLEGKGCEEAQGYLLSRPVPVDEFGSMMRIARKVRRLHHAG